MKHGKKVFIIAEAGVNHNGSPKMAERLIDAACEAGADAVKFQTFQTEKIMLPGSPKAVYQLKNTSANETSREMIKKLELDQEMHVHLMQYAANRDIRFLSTPFDEDSLDFLDKILKLPFLKIASGEITNAPLLLKAALSRRKIILSTGMSSLGEIEEALGVLAYGYETGKENNGGPSRGAFEAAYCSEAGQRSLRENVSLLHCTTEYPAPFEEANLRVLGTLQQCFGLPVGYSDHTPGTAVSLAAAALGAVIVEKHLTLDRNLPGPDHKASLEPGEFSALVREIRRVELALGSPLKKPAASEVENRTIVRKSIVAACGIRKGELFTGKNLAVKRPGEGISPMRFWDLLGKEASRDFEKDEVIV